MKKLAKLWPRKPGIFGTRPDFSDQLNREKAISAVLSRNTNIGALDALIYAYKPEPRVLEISKVALVLDSSAFLRLGPQTDVIDYLNLKHDAPVILPGQAIQEFWNNNLTVADSIATGISKRFEELKKEVLKVDDSFHDFSYRFAGLIDEFRDSYGYAYDGNTVRKTMSLFEVLKSKAITSYVRRDKFLEFSRNRKRTKTPPGFKDDLDGDFFVWLDMLDCLLIARSRQIHFDSVVLVSNDKKLDWSREGIAHPILSAEIAALLGVPFETWDVQKLVQKVAAANE